MEITGSSYIIVRNWEKFQHYRDRRPVWIKLYTDLLKDPNFLELSLASRGLLSTIWLARASAGEVQPLASLRTASRQPIYSTQLISLNDAGFIDISASKPLAPYIEVEKEKETPYPLQGRPVDNSVDNSAHLGGPRLRLASSQRREQLHEQLLEKAWEECARFRDSALAAAQLEALERRYNSRLDHLEREQILDSLLRR